MTEQRHYPGGPSRRSLLALVLVVMAGIILTTGLFWEARRSELDKFRVQFERDAAMRSNHIAQKMEECLTVIKGLQRFFAGSDHVAPEQFATFTVPFLAEQRELQALEWIPRVSSAERTRFEEMGLRREMPNGRITELDPNGDSIPAGVRETYYPVFYVEPPKGNEKAVGFDLGSDPVRRAALEKARDTGRPAVTERIRLVQETEDQFGFLIFLPVYRKGMPTETVEQRREALKGFALGVFRAGDVLRAVMGNTEPLGLPFDLLDLSAPQERRLLHHWSARFDTQDSRKSRFFPIPPRYQGKFAFAGRQWAAEITANATYMERHYPFAYLLILPVGFLLTFVLGFYIRAILGRRVELERTVLERTAELLENNARTSHLNDVLLAIRDVSRVINSEKEPLELLKGVCDSLVQTCGYVIVWIGRPEAGSKRVIPVARSGAGSDCMQHAPITWDDSPTGRGPAGTAIRERRPVVFDDLSKDPRFTLWKDPVTACGAASIASVPLLHHDRLLGALTVKADRPQAFNAEEVDLLSAMAADVARALQSLEDERAREQAEKEVQSLSRQNQLILDAVGEGIVGLDLTGGISFINPAGAAIAGYKVEELIQKDFHKVVHHSRSDGTPYPLHECPVFESLTTGVCLHERDEVFWRKDGASFPVAYSSTPILEEGKIAGAVLTFRDITERKLAQEEINKYRDHLEDLVKERTAELTAANEQLTREVEDRRRAEEALRESQALLSTIIESSPFEYWAMGQDGRYILANSECVDHYGNVLGRKPEEICEDKATLSVWQNNNRKAYGGELVKGEVKSSFGGVERFYHNIIAPIRDGDRTRGILGVNIDISELKMMEMELRKSRDELELRVKERTAALEKANEELRLIPSKLIAVQEEERKRLASELHDSIGQTLAAVKFRIEMVLALRYADDTAAALNQLEQFIPILQRAIEETRCIYMGLRPSMLDGMGLLATLEWLRRESMNLYPDRHIELETGIAEKEIPESLKVNIFRITQEALTNVAKHSEAEWVDLSIAKKGDEIELAISDDGVGMNLDLILQTGAAGTLGLVSMRERAELTGGCFSIESTPGEGTTIRVCWPIEDQLQKGGVT